MLQIYEKHRGSFFPFGSKFCYQHLKTHLYQTHQTKEKKQHGIRNFSEDFEPEKIYTVKNNLESSIPVADNITGCFQTGHTVSLKHKKVNNIIESTKVLLKFFTSKLLFCGKRHNSNL